MKHYLTPFIICLYVFGTFKLKGQDLIIKTNGDTLHVKLIELDLNAVSYKKNSMPDGPNFILNKKEIFLIKYSNGDIEYFSDQQSIKTVNTNSSSVSSNNKTYSPDPSSSGKNKIEYLNEQYLINKKNARQKDVNRLMESSKNPAVLIGLKAAKSMSLAQKITKITSYPTTILGGVTTLVSVVEGYQLVQRGRATGRTFLNMGLSFVGTITLPITSKILSKKSDKMYEKLIDMYNITN
ncbi:MAG: hypothetical protein Q7W45_01295 [Bacteroidota bacterium]|nr:hypothetical protein [Bacteroidota bacterium]MDP3146513.1 hypothetical protein [Bacteroidota bacterium]